MVNYYELLSIPQNAESDSIRQAIRKARRQWNNRSNSPDANIRAEAERHVREIAEAEKILLDASKRKEYDRKLRDYKEPSRPAEQQSDGSWEEEYFRAYNRGLCSLAAQIAQRVISSNDRNGRAWFLYGEAIRQGGDNRGSIDPLLRAAMLLPNDTNPYRQLGFAYLGENNLRDAIQAFSSALQIDPQQADLHMCLAKAYRIDGRITSALSEATKAHNMDPNDNDVKLEYFLALLEDAREAMSYNRSSGKHLIISKKQLDYVNGRLQEMALAMPENEYKEECERLMEKIVSCVVEAESYKGGFFGGKYGYQLNYEKSNNDTRSSGLQ